MSQTLSIPPDLAALPADALIPAETIAAVLDCSVRQIGRMVESGALPPPLRIGMLDRWRAGTLLEWFRRQSNATIAETETPKGVSA